MILSRVPFKVRRRLGRAMFAELLSLWEIIIKRIQE